MKQALKHSKVGIADAQILNASLRLRLAGVVSFPQNQPEMYAARVHDLIPQHPNQIIAIILR